MTTCEWVILTETAVFFILLFAMFMAERNMRETFLSVNQKLFDEKMNAKRQLRLVEAQLDELNRDTIQLIQTLLKSKLASAVMSEIRRNGIKPYLATTAMEHVNSGEYDHDEPTVEQKAEPSEPKVPGGAEGEA